MLDEDLVAELDLGDHVRRDVCPQALLLGDELLQTAAGEGVLCAHVHRPWEAAARSAASGQHTAPFLRCPVGLPSDPGRGWPVPACHLANRMSPWGSAPWPSQVGVGGVLRGLRFQKHPFLQTWGAPPRPHGSEVPRSHCQAPPTVPGYVEGTVFAVPGKASRQNAGDRRGLNPLRKIQAESRSWKERGATGAPQRPQDSPVGNSSLFKKGQRDRWTDAHVQKDEIRLVPHTT